VRGNPQFTRAQRTAATMKARAAYESANRIGEAWTLTDEELATRETDLVQAIGSGLTGATGYNPGHFAELAGVIAAQSARKGNPLTYRDALQEAKARIGAIYLPPSQVGGGAAPSSTPANPAGDTSKTYFYDDTPFAVGNVVVTRTSTDPEKKLWDATVKALVKVGFPQRVLDALGSGSRLRNTRAPRPTSSRRSKRN
jgi:hypothetical protein